MAQGVGSDELSDGSALAARRGDPAPATRNERGKGLVSFGDSPRTLFGIDSGGGGLERRIDVWGFPSVNGGWADSGRFGWGGDWPRAG